MRLIRLKQSLLLGVLLVVLVSPNALAFSGFGDGTSGKPYYIGNCDQLQEMEDDLDGIYKLVRNIDCSGKAYSPVGDDTDPFTGTLNGQGFTIKNLELSVGFGNTGIFGTITGATVTNLKISDFLVDGVAFTGSLAGKANGGTISDIRIQNVDVAGVDNVGAFIGRVGGATVSRIAVVGSSVSGSSSQIGGSIGSSVGPTTLSDMYISGGSVTSGADFIGGLIGHMDSGPTVLQRVYSFNTVNSTGNHVGGLVGFTTASGGQQINHSFSASSIGVGNLNTSTGAAFGTSNATTLNLWFDDGASSWDNCVGDGSADCTAANVSNASPSYFENNDTVEPFTEWDFDTVWQTNATDYPSLRPLVYTGITDAPNSNDADGNGTDDSHQPTINSVMSTGGVWSTIVIPSGYGCSVESPTSVSVPAADTAATYALETMTGFSLYCRTSGATVPVTIIFDKVYDTSKLVVRHYNSNNNTYRTVTGATFGTITIGGIQKTTATYGVTDGGELDTDGVANGVIVDPVSLATVVTLADTGTSTGLITLIAISLVSGGLYVTKKQL